MLKIIHFFRWDAEPNEGIDGGEKAQTIRNLRVESVDEDEARAALRAVANGMYGHELERWKFLPDTNGLNDRLNANDKGTSRPAKVVSYELNSDGKPNFGNYLAIRWYN